MPELKRGFSQAKMNKDMDERLVPSGQYRDALNIQVHTSDGSNVGSAQNLEGNTIQNSMAAEYNVDPKYPGSSAAQAFYGLPLFQSASINPTTGLPFKSVGTGTCVGNIALPDKDKIYYFISAGDINYQPGWIDVEPPHIKKDFILEYNTVTERLKYVFVDIYHVETEAAHTVINSNYIYIYDLTSPSIVNPTITNYSNLPIGSSVNITGVRTGMIVYGTFTNVAGVVTDITIDQGITVTDIEYEASNNRWKISISSPLTMIGTTSLPGETIKFRAPRVLNFDKDNLITGINVIDDLLFWTDNSTEPKKINITRSKAGTGGVEYLVGGGTAGSALANTGTTKFIFDGDTPYFHTRLVTDKNQKGKLEVETSPDGRKATWVKESHVTVIKKGPTQPLELEMSRIKNPRVPIGSTIPNSPTATVTSWNFSDPSSSPLVLLESGVETTTGSD